MNNTFMRLMRHRDNEFQTKHTILNTFVTLNGIIIGSILTIVTIKNTFSIKLFGVVLICLNVSSIILLLISFRLSIRESKCWQLYHERKMNLIRIYDKKEPEKYRKKKKQNYDRCKPIGERIRKRVAKLESLAQNFTLDSFIFFLISIVIL